MANRAVRRRQLAAVSLAAPPEHHGPDGLRSAAQRERRGTTVVDLAAFVARAQAGQPSPDTAA